MNRLFLFILLFILGTGCFAYNFESTVKIPIKLSVAEEISSEKDVYEGQIVNFKAVNSVKYNNVFIIRRGDIVPARVKVVISSGMNGIPASIIFDNFKIQGISSSQLDESFEVFGQDRSLWVFPLKWALTPLPPTGSLTNFIKGGHVKVKRGKILTIYYHPHWT